jgi:4-hydroxy-tetrahydrodipicolinate reductase
VERSEGRSHVFSAPNFAIGAVMMMRFSRLAASWLPDAEVIELHHASKRDSPSGTSLATVGEILAGRAEAHAEPVAPPAFPVEILPGARGAERDGVHVHSVRLPGLVAHQEVIFGGPGQTLTIRHDTTDRVAFMPGVLLAVREIANHPGLTIGLQTLLGL